MLGTCGQRFILGSSNTGRFPHPKAGGQGLCTKLDKGYSLANRNVPELSQKLLTCQVSVKRQFRCQRLAWNVQLTILITLFILQGLKCMPRSHGRQEGCDHIRLDPYITLKLTNSGSCKNYKSLPRTLSSRPTKFPLVPTSKRSHHLSVLLYWRSTHETLSNTLDV